MPDITMCANKTCPLRQKCYRFMAKPDRLQSFSAFTPTDVSDNNLYTDVECDHYVKIQEGDELRSDSEFNPEK